MIESPSFYSYDTAWCVWVTSHTRFPWSQPVSCEGGGGCRVNVVALHYDEVSSSTKIKKAMISDTQCEWVSEWVCRNFSFRSNWFHLALMTTLCPYELLTPTNAGKNMAGTRTCVVEFLGWGLFHCNTIGIDTIGLRSNPVLRGVRPATNRLKLGVVHHVV